MLRSMSPSARKRRSRKPGITLLGAGNLARALGSALLAAGYRVDAIAVRDRASSLAHARSLARKLGAGMTTIDRLELQSPVVWLCVRDDAITLCAAQLAAKGNFVGAAFHSSGALSSSA